jgi:hypothetical protein
MIGGFLFYFINFYSQKVKPCSRTTCSPQGCTVRPRKGRWTVFDWGGWLRVFSVLQNTVGADYAHRTRTKWLPPGHIFKNPRFEKRPSNAGLLYYVYSYTRCCPNRQRNFWEFFKGLLTSNKPESLSFLQYLWFIQSTAPVKGWEDGRLGSHP